MRLALTEVYEVATFYAHFDVVKEGQTPPPAVTVRVCDSLSCALAGAERLLADLPKQARSGCAGGARALHGRLRSRAGLRRRSCPGDARPIRRKSPPPRRSPRIAHAYPTPAAFDAYVDGGGYELLKACIGGERTRDDIIKVGQRCRPARPWRRRFSDRAQMVAGARRAGAAPVRGQCDEGEPGTFKDRYYLERDPHRFIEGMLIAAWIVEAADTYLYVRDEYPEVILLLAEEIAKVEAAGLSRHTKIHLRRGAGAYICGEESAMIESIEGKRGLPRHRPPYVAQVGLFGRPTLEQNVETLFWVRDIVEKGADWFTSQGRHERKGFRSFSVSGRVKNPGVKLAPAGVTARELIDEFCGGMADGHTFKGYLPGGASGGILPASMADIPLDFGTLEKYGCFVGSHAVVILSDKDDMKAVALNLIRFFEDESCGQCTPCRVGTEKAAELMAQGPWDPALLDELSALMRDASICGLGQAAPNPLLCVLKYFPGRTERSRWDIGD